MTINQSILSGIPSASLQAGILDLSKNSPKITSVSESALEQVVGQKEAKALLVNILEGIASGVSIRKPGDTKPITSSIFTGPSGVGKTLLAKAAQEILNEYYGNNLAIIKINCAEFSGKDPYSLTRLVGASAGYIGSDKKPLFHPDNIKGKGRVILLDEIEKGGPPFWDILLSILDDGTTDINYSKPNNNSEKKPLLPITSPPSTPGTEEEENENSYLRAFFTDCIIIMTSNVGNERIESELSNKSQIGFAPQTLSQGDIHTEEILEEELSKQFRVEMQGRFNSIVTFNHLSKKDASEILQKLITRIVDNALRSTNGTLIEFSNEAKEKILHEITKSDNFRKFGGRHIEKYLEKEILPPISRAINSINFTDNGNHYCLCVIVDQGEIRFSKVPLNNQTKEQVTNVLESH